MSSQTAQTATDPSETILIRALNCPRCKTLLAVGCLDVSELTVHCDSGRHRVVRESTGDRFCLWIQDPINGRWAAMLEEDGQVLGEAKATDQ